MYTHVHTHTRVFYYYYTHTGALSAILCCLPMLAIAQPCDLVVDCVSIALESLSPPNLSQKGALSFAVEFYR